MKTYGNDFHDNVPALKGPTPLLPPIDGNGQPLRGCWMPRVVPFLPEVKTSGYSPLGPFGAPLLAIHYSPRRRHAALQFLKPVQHHVDLGEGGLRLVGGLGHQEALAVGVSEPRGACPELAEG